jgi:hypothetical protein
VVKVGLDGLGVLGCKMGQDEAAVMSGLFGVHKGADELLVEELRHRRGVRAHGGVEEVAVVGRVGRIGARAAKMSSEYFSASDAM